MSPVAVTYVIVVSGALTIAATLFARRGDGFIFDGPIVIDGFPVHVGATEESPLLTEEIERIEAQPDTPALLSTREEREREEAAYAIFFAEFDAAMGKEFDRFVKALEPVRQTLKTWHADGRNRCQSCLDEALDMVQSS